MCRWKLFYRLIFAQYKIINNNNNNIIIIINFFRYQAPVVQKQDSAIHPINLYPADKYQGNQ